MFKQRKEIKKQQNDTGNRNARHNKLLFSFLQLVDLFREFVDGILLFLLQRSDLRLALYLRLFQIASQLLQLSLTFLVQIHLRTGTDIEHRKDVDNIHTVKGSQEASPHETMFAPSELNFVLDFDRASFSHVILTFVNFLYYKIICIPIEFVHIVKTR